MAPGEVTCALGPRSGSELAGIRDRGWRGQHFGGECRVWEDLEASVWGNEKKQKAIEGLLAAIKSILTFLESSLWQKEVERKEEAGRSAGGCCGFPGRVAVTRTVAERRDKIRSRESKRRMGKVWALKRIVASSPKDVLRYP